MSLTSQSWAQTVQMICTCLPFLTGTPSESSALMGGLAQFTQANLLKQKAEHLAQGRDRLVVLG